MGILLQNHTNPRVATPTTSSLTPSSATTIDRKLAKANFDGKLPFFLQKRIKFCEAVDDDTRASNYTYRDGSKKRSLEYDHKLSSSNGSEPRLFPNDAIKLRWNQIRSIGPGFTNLGNTCFLNSVLQCLLYTAPFSNVLLEQDHSKACQINKDRKTPGNSAASTFCLLCELQKLVRTCLGNPEGASKSSKSDSNSPTGGNLIQGARNSLYAYTPSHIVSRLKSIGKHFRIGRQEDAHEFLRFVVEALQRGCLDGREEREISASLKETTLIHTVFGGRLESQVICHSCNHKSNTLEPFLDLSLEMRNANSIQTALEQFTAPEKLSSANKYRCEACKQLTAATKQFRIHSAPNVLTIHLKRFQVSPFGMASKLNREVVFEPSLDLTPFVQSTETAGRKRVDLEYELYAVLVHEGQTCNSGHYHCFVRGSNGAWYSLNDESVHQVSFATVLRQRAYILFYQRKEPPFLPKDAIEKLEGAVGKKDGQDKQPCKQAKLEHSTQKRKAASVVEGSKAVTLSSRLLPTPPPTEDEDSEVDVLGLENAMTEKVGVSESIQDIVYPKHKSPVDEKTEFLDVVSNSWWHLSSLDSAKSPPAVMLSKGLKKISKLWKVTTINRT